jgi:hypothetical protein
MPEIMLARSLITSKAGKLPYELYSVCWRYYPRKII